MLCSETSLVKHRATVNIIRPLRCRCWHCEECQPERVKDLKGLARRGEPRTFLTLTVNPNRLDSPTARAQALVNAFLVLRRRAKRLLRLKSFPFLAVFEKTKRGEPHLHIMARIPFISQKWISDAMDELMGAPVVDIRRIDNVNRVAAYVAKYIAKAPAKFDGCKRYWRSQDFELEKHKWKPPAPDPLDWWEVLRARPAVLVNIALQEGAFVEFKENKWFIHKNGKPYAKPPDPFGAMK